ncbi:hypothetical protein GCM10011391_38190 [Pullulanibacillus camelliae]|uniref:DUF3231 family protein n=1 Tax=Pullulanibacillus camelliae TaxID=1707096 RepID=A0A8J3E0V6_9BACL|nr:DUF3231 family protein [Pullulanibacillus camelliae]GGE55536.1 hypothetical protein GCM10011391_38190 [Pullulanibacillus camelliae]
MMEGKPVRLTATEVAQIWAQYMNDSASVCVLSYFLEKAEDMDIKPVIELALHLSQEHLRLLSDIFGKEGFALPYGFKPEEDVEFTAPKLYSDAFVLHFIHQMAKIGLTSYSESVSSAVRADITDYYSTCLDETMKLFQISKDVLLSKGLFVRSPYIPHTEQIEMVKKQGFMWDILGEKRPLAALEIANLYANIQRNAIGAATLTGFSQVAQSKEVKHFFIRGIEIAKKHIKLFAGKLEESDLAAPMTWQAEITSSTTATFSDKIMMYFTSMLISLSIGYYGIGLAQSPRIDIGALYNRLSGEIQLYSEDGANLMIANEWLEQAPLAADRDELIKRNK